MCRGGCPGTPCTSTCLMATVLGDEGSHNLVMKLLGLGHDIAIPGGDEERYDIYSGLRWCLDPCLDVGSTGCISISISLCSPLPQFGAPFHIRAHQRDLIQLSG